MRLPACFPTRGRQGSRSRLLGHTLAAGAWAGRARGLTHLARRVRTFRQGLAGLRTVRVGEVITCQAPQEPGNARPLWHLR